MKIKKLRRKSKNFGEKNNSEFYVNVHFGDSCGNANFHFK